MSAILRKYVSVDVDSCGAYFVCKTQQQKHESTHVTFGSKCTHITRASLTLNWLARSSSDSTGCSSRDTVRKAARFAVYVAIMMKPNTHQVAASRRPDSARGASPPP